MPKIRKKSPTHEKADANITSILVTVTSAVLGVGCHTHTATHIVRSIIVRYAWWLFVTVSARHALMISMMNASSMNGANYKIKICTETEKPDLCCTVISL